MTSIDKTISRIIDRLYDASNSMCNNKGKISPCSICSKSVRNNQKGIQCDTCMLWVHAKCNGISDTEYVLLGSSDDFWSCLVCNVKGKIDRMEPFLGCDNSELSNIYISDIIKFLESLPRIIFRYF